MIYMILCMLRFLFKEETIIFRLLEGITVKMFLLIGLYQRV